MNPNRVVRMLGQDRQPDELCNQCAGALVIDLTGALVPIVRCDGCAREVPLDAFPSTPKTVVSIDATGLGEFQYRVHIPRNGLGFIEGVASTWGAARLLAAEAERRLQRGVPG